MSNGSPKDNASNLGPAHTMIQGVVQLRSIVFLLREASSSLAMVILGFSVPDMKEGKGSTLGSIYSRNGQRKLTSMTDFVPKTLNLEGE